MNRTLIISASILLLLSCTDNGDKQSRPDPAIDSTSAGTADTSHKDPNSSQNSGRTGDSTGTRSPNQKRDSSQHK